MRGHACLIIRCLPGQTPTGWRLGSVKDQIVGLHFYRLKGHNGYESDGVASIHPSQPKEGYQGQSNQYTGYQDISRNTILHGTTLGWINLPDRTETIGMIPRLRCDRFRKANAAIGTSIAAFGLLHFARQCGFTFKACTCSSQ